VYPHLQLFEGKEISCQIPLQSEQEAAQHSVHPTPGRTPGLSWWESARFHLCLRQGAGKQFPRLQVGSGKVALSRPTQQRVTQTVGLLFQKE